MSGLSLRPAAPDDMQAIQAIYAHHVLHGLGSFEEVPPDVDELVRRWRTLVERGLPWLVAEIDGGTVAGYAYAASYRARPAYRSTVEDSVYVAPAAQGSGVGRALLRALIEECEQRDFRLMVAVIGDTASRGSIALHEALGFRPVGVIEGIGYKHGRWLTTVLMQRALGPGTSAQPTIPVPASHGRG